MPSHEQQIAVQLLGKGMGSIDNQPNGVLAAAVHHLRHVHSACQMNAVHQLYLLTVAAGRIVVPGACLFEHLRGLASFSRSSEYKYHL